MARSNSNPLTSQRYFEEKSDEYGVRARIVEPVTLVNTETGEKYDAERVIKFTNHQNFVKAYIADLLDILCGFTAKIDVVVFILENTNYITNLYLGSIKKTAELSGISYPTVHATFKILEEKKLIKKVEAGAWMVNAALLAKGSEKKRRMLIEYFEAEDTLREMNDGNKKNNKG